MSFIAEELYKDIIKSVPILCVDVVVRIKGSYLLVRRREEPLKDVFWVPGGRVFLEETLDDAAWRKLAGEVGIKRWGELKKIGLYEDIFEESSLGKHAYHTLSVVFQYDLNTLPSTINIDRTSAEWGLFDNLPERLLTKLERCYE